MKRLLPSIIVYSIVNNKREQLKRFNSFEDAQNFVNECKDADKNYGENRDYEIVNIKK